MLNAAGSEERAYPSVNRGFSTTADPQQADIILMNTCTVRDQAEHRAQSNLGRLREWKEADPERVLIVAGCAASRWGDSIKKRYPYIDLVAPATQIEKFPELVAEVLKDRWDGIAETEKAFTVNREPWTEASDHGSRTTDHAVSNELFGDEQTAYVTIM